MSTHVNYFSVPPKFGYSTQFASAHPAGGSRYKRLGPAGPMLRTGLQPPFLPLFSAYGHQPFGRCLRVFLSCKFAPAPICLEPPQGPPDRAAQVTAQGLQQLVPRPNISGIQQVSKTGREVAPYRRFSLPTTRGSDPSELFTKLFLHPVR
jgi:hypothetical protein